MGLLVLFSFSPIWAVLWSGLLVCPTFVCPSLAYPLLQGSDSLPYFSLSVSCRGRTVCPVLVCLPQGRTVCPIFGQSSTADSLSYFSLSPAGVRQFALFLVCLPQRTVCPILVCSSPAWVGQFVLFSPIFSGVVRPVCPI